MRASNIQEAAAIAASSVRQTLEDHLSGFLPLSLERQELERIYLEAWNSSGSTLEPWSLARSPWSSSAKTDKTLKNTGARMAVSYMSPHNSLGLVFPAYSGESACLMAEVTGCHFPCFGNDYGRGHLAYPQGNARKAMLSRTLFLRYAPHMFGQWFAETLLQWREKEWRKHVSAGPLNVLPGVPPLVARGDGTTDLGILLESVDLLEELGVTVREYTKVLPRWERLKENVVLSLAPHDFLRRAQKVEEARASASIVFRTKDIGEAMNCARSLIGSSSDALSPLAWRIVDGDREEPVRALINPRATLRVLTLKTKSLDVPGDRLSFPVNA